jgi:hypothetical protein
LHKFIKRVELLSDKSFLFEEAGYDSPAVFLRDFFTVLIDIRRSAISRVVIGYWFLNGGCGYDKKT